MDQRIVDPMPSRVTPDGRPYCPRCPVGRLMLPSGPEWRCGTCGCEVPRAQFRPPTKPDTTTLAGRDWKRLPYDLYQWVCGSCGHSTLIADGIRSAAQPFGFCPHCGYGGGLLRVAATFKAVIQVVP